MSLNETNSPTHLTLGFSSCPNDCFIFDAMVNGRIDTEGLTFDVYMDDVESLNHKAFENKLDITKLSYHAYAYITKNYQLLNAGSALGNGCGPILVGKNKDVNFIITSLQSKMTELTIAIPGTFTTANFLFALAFPFAINTIEMNFSEIEDAVLRGDVDAGLIIHENRFTYEEKGLNKIIDLGEFWETLAIAPIPLGGIVIRRSFPDELKQKVNRVIRRSVEYAFVNPNASKVFVKLYSQSMQDDVIKKHIDLYVNNYSVDLGEKGKRAVKILFNKAQELGVIQKIEEEIFLS